MPFEQNGKKRYIRVGFKDIFKSSFLNNYSQFEISEINVLMTFTVAAILGVYIFFFYKYRTRNAFYSKEFAVSLVIVTIITTAVIIAIQQSIVVSLGMVGALSIVRFRTAVKNPMDLAFMFWAISTGIICGACISVVAVILAIVISAIILVLDYVPTKSASKIISVSYKNDEALDEKVLEIIKQYCSKINEKSRNVSSSQIDVIYELRIKDGNEMTMKLSGIDGVYGCSLISYDGNR